MFALTCKPAMTGFSFEVNVLVNTIITFTVVTCLYMYHLDRAREDVLETGTGLIDGIMEDIVQSSSDQEKEQLGVFVENLQFQLQGQPDDKFYALEHREWLRKFNIFVMIMGMVVLGLVLYFVYNTSGQCVDLGELMFENALVFGIVYAIWKWRASAFK